MKAVILAAGAARRLVPMINSIPKCLIKIGDKSILENQLDALQFYGIEDVLIVVGYLKEQIIEKIGNQYKTMNISYIENPLFFFDEYGLLALAGARIFCRSGFFLF